MQQWANNQALSQDQKTQYNNKSFQLQFADQTSSTGQVKFEGSVAPEEFNFHTHSIKLASLVATEKISNFVKC